MTILPIQKQTSATTPRPSPEQLDADLATFAHRNGGMTPGECETQARLVQFVRGFQQLPGVSSPNIEAMVGAVHECQDPLGMRILRREYPGFYLAIGGSLDQDVRIERDNIARCGPDAVFSFPDPSSATQLADVLTHVEAAYAALTPTHPTESREFAAGLADCRDVLRRYQVGGS